MAKIDELKEKVEEGLKVLCETVQDLTSDLEKQAKMGKKRYFDLSKIQRDLKRIYTEMGQYVYSELVTKREIRSDDPFFTDRVAAISRMKDAISAIEREIEAMKKS